MEQPNKNKGVITLIIRNRINKERFGDDGRVPFAPTVPTFVPPEKFYPIDVINKLKASGWTEDTASLWMDLLMSFLSGNEVTRPVMPPEALEMFTLGLDDLGWSSGETNERCDCIWLSRIYDLDGEIEIPNPVEAAKQLFHVMGDKADYFGNAAFVVWTDDLTHPIGVLTVAPGFDKNRPFRPSQWHKMLKARPKFYVHPVQDYIEKAYNLGFLLSSNKAIGELNKLKQKGYESLKQSRAMSQMGWEMSKAYVSVLFFGDDRKVYNYEVDLGNAPLLGSNLRPLFS